MIQSVAMHAPLKEPFERFAQLYEAAKASTPKDPNAMTLATVDAEGKPSARIVLLKAFDERGFVFYTNYESRKGHELIGQKVAALCFYWPSMDRQVRIEGAVEQVTAAEADVYFASRERLSQLGAWASLQSQVLDARATLEGRLDAVRTQYEGKPVPRPLHWSGFRVVPQRIELWHAGEHRLHERDVYLRDGDGWAVTLLFP